LSPPTAVVLSAAVAEVEGSRARLHDHGLKQEFPWQIQGWQNPSFPHAPVSTEERSFPLNPFSL